MKIIKKQQQRRGLRRKPKRHLTLCFFLQLLLFVSATEKVADHLARLHLPAKGNLRRFLVLLRRGLPVRQWFRFCRSGRDGVVHGTVLCWTRHGSGLFGGWSRLGR